MRNYNKHKASNFRGGWGKSSELLAQFINECIFNSSLDDNIKTGMRAAKSPEDVCDLLNLKNALDEIVKARTEEIAASVESSGAASVESTPVPEHPPSTPVSDGSSWSGEPMSAAVKQLHDEIVAKRGRPCTADEIDMLKRYGLTAARNLWHNITLIKCHNSEKELTAAFRKSPVVSTRSNGIQEFTGIFLDPKALSVSTTHPAHRVPAVDPDKVKMLLRSFMNTREFDDPSNPQLHDGDIYLILDGAISTNKNKLAACFIDNNGDPVAKKDKCINVTIDEDHKIYGCTAAQGGHWSGPSTHAVFKI